MRKAAFEGNLTTVQELLRAVDADGNNAGVDVNDADDDGVTALMAAAYEGRDRVVKELLMEPACKPDLRDKWGRTAFIYGVTNNRSKLTEWMGKLKHVDEATGRQVHTVDISISDNFGKPAWDADLEGMDKADPAVISMASIRYWRKTTKEWKELSHAERISTLKWSTAEWWLLNAGSKRATKRARIEPEGENDASPTNDRALGNVSGPEPGHLDDLTMDDSDLAIDDGDSSEPESPCAGPSSAAHLGISPVIFEAADTTMDDGVHTPVEEMILTPDDEETTTIEETIEEKIRKIENEETAAETTFQAAQTERTAKQEKLRSAKAAIAALQLEIGELQKGSAANNAHASTIAEFDEKIRSLTREDEDEEAKHVAAQEERKKEREELEERKGRVEELERQIEQLRKAFLL